MQINLIINNTLINKVDINVKILILVIILIIFS
jgi:hypothetical protein